MAFEELPSTQIEDIYPLSPLQQGMLFHSLLTPGAGLYIEQMACTIKGTLDAVAFERAWHILVERHSILRTAFVWEGLDEPLQVVQLDVKVPFEFHDWRNLTQTDQEAQFDEFLTQQRTQGFELTQAPLMSLALIQCGESEFQFIWCHHHLLLDGWGVPIVLREVFAAYEAIRQNRVPTLPPVRPYRDYIGWLKEQSVEQAEQYWRQYLQGFSAPTYLSAFQDTNNTASQPARYEFNLDEATSEQLAMLAREHQITLNTLVLGAWTKLMSVHTTAEDVVFGVTVSGRPPELAGSDAMLGLFINTLPLRATVPADVPVMEWLAKLQVQQAEMRQFESTPLVHIQGWSEIPPGTALFDTLFIFENYPSPPNLTTGQERPTTISLEKVKARGTTNYPLTFVAAPGRELHFLAVYDEAIFPGEFVSGLVGQMIALLENLTQSPDQTLNHWSPLSEAERHKILVEWNPTSRPFPDEKCIHHLFEQQVRKTPEAVAVVFQDQSVTYRELNYRADQLAFYLQLLGVKPETLVGLCVNRSIEMLVGMLGILKAGGAFVPLDPSYPKERLAFMLADSQVPVLVTQSVLLSRLPRYGSQVVYLDQPLPTLSHRPFPVEATSHHLAYVIYTSGSTGTPKGTLLQHQGLCNLALAQIQDMGFAPGSRVVQFSSLSFDASVFEIFATLVGGSTLYLGTRVDLMPGAELAQFLTHHQINVATLPPSAAAALPEGEYPALRTLITAGESCTAELVQKWTRPGRRFINAYGPTEATVCATFTDCEPTDHHPTIGRPVANIQIFLLDQHGQPVPVDVPGELWIGGVSLARGYLNQPELTAERFKPGFRVEKPGFRVEKPEFRVEKPGFRVQGSGFRDSDSDTLGQTTASESANLGQDLKVPLTHGSTLSKPRTPNPEPRTLYKTGDLARYRADGQIEFLGRIDDQVKLRGHRIELGEIEAVLNHHPLVKESVVVARDDAQTGKQLTAYVVLNQPARPSTGSLSLGFQPGISTQQQVEIADFLRHRLPEFMVPTVFVVLEALPISPSGKIDRRALPAPERILRADDQESQAVPQTPVEEMVADLWSQVLHLPTVHRHSNFFALGGHSLLATQLASRLRETFQLDLPLSLIFEAPTVAQQASWITRQQLQGASGGSAASAPPPPLVAVSREHPLPLSFSQLRTWFMEQLEPSEPLAGGVRLHGKLDLAVLERCFVEIIERHEVLRTSFETVNGQPIQVIHRTLRFQIEVINVQDASSPEERRARIEEFLAREGRKPFQLTTGPLLRVALIQLAPESWILFFAVHHIISDGWSLEIFGRELAVLYRAFSKGEPSPLRPLPIQYADFAVWQRNWLQGDVLKAHLKYWKDQLTGAPAVLELPTDSPRPEVWAYRGMRESHTFSRTSTEKLKALSHANGVTPFMTLFAAYNVLLSRLSGQEDLLVGIPVTNRNHLEVEKLIGFFVNTLVLRTKLTHRPTFADLLSQTRTTALGAFAHQDLPFEKLIEELQPERDLRRTPLLQVMFSFESALRHPRRPETPTEAETLRMSPLEINLAIDRGTSNLDLTVFFRETADGITSTWEYNRELFESTTIQRFAQILEIILETVTTNPDIPITEIPLLSEAEFKQVTIDWNATHTDFPLNVPVHILFEQQVKRTPFATAVTFQGKAVSYRELNQRATQVASHLASLGVGIESLVGLCLDRSFEMVVGMLGILKAGAAYVPLDPAYPKERLSWMIQDAGLKSILTTTQMRDRLPDQIPTVIALDSQFFPPSVFFQSPTPDPENLAYVIYTSGSTGLPKGVLIPHRGLTNLALAQIKAFGITGKSRVLQFASLSFDASVSEVFTTLLAGATLVLASKEDLRPGPELIDLLHREHISTVTLPPSVLAVLPDAELPHLHTLVTAGEACSVDIVHRWGRNRRFLNAYGPTETSVCATIHHCTPTNRKPPIGRPIDNVQVYVLDHAQQPLPAGIPGEICIGGVGVARGYLNRPGLTEERFQSGFRVQGSGLKIPELEGSDQAHGKEAQDLLNLSKGSPQTLNPEPRTLVLEPRTLSLYRTGDLGRWLEDGTLEFLGRLDNQVKIRGFRIELGEIEAVMQNVQGVVKAVVLADTSSTGEARLVSFVVLDQTIPGDAVMPALTAYLKERLPEYMLPAVITPLDSLPLTVSGKIDQRALLGQSVSRPVQAGNYVAPRTPIEEELVELWSKLLKIEQIGVYDNFFELGGHSLLLTRLASQIREQFGVELPLRILFDAPTIDSMTSAIADYQLSQTDSDEAAELLAEIQHLSPEEIRALLEDE
ncbi:MAG: amino acid adenylation domain-containing protein [Acidobacteria bacterium]|nr:amino acid adenylation domain-containing protein [Acidobacteriota bacterium]